MKTVGIIGGLGPLAGAHFYQRIIELTPSGSDENHVPVRLWSSLEIPSRVNHLRGRGPSPVPALVRMAQGLVTAGAEFLVIPSSTTHYYYDSIASTVSVPVLNLLEEVAEAIAKTTMKRIAILATTPTVEFTLYQSAFAKHELMPIYPDPVSQTEIMDVIYAVKSGQSRQELQEVILSIVQKPWTRSADSVLLACTEIPLIFPHKIWLDQEGRPLFDATDILARATIRESLDEGLKGGPQ